MATRELALKMLVRQRHMTYEGFCREWDRTAATLDERLKGRFPGHAQYYRWLRGELVNGRPYPDACRMLEAMFPGWTIDRLFSPYAASVSDAPATRGLILSSEMPESSEPADVGRNQPSPEPEVAAWEVAELAQRLGYSEIGATTIQLLTSTVGRLCTDYGREPAHLLHPVIREWIKHISAAMDKRTTLAEHRELLVNAAWLFLLGGCVEYDMGWNGPAEASRIAALQIGRETSHGEIQAWAWEMAAWFALTQGRMEDVAAYVDAGQHVGGPHSVVVQLDAQHAKAAARMGDRYQVNTALDSGFAKLSRIPRPDNPRNHFVVDPDKWDFYAMDAYRLLGDDVRATTHAREVLRLGQGTDGRELAPMRMAEARLTLGVSAARVGELEEAVAVGETAFNAQRKSLPTLLMVANELKSELVTRYPREAPTVGYCERLEDLKRTDNPEIES